MFSNNDILPLLFCLITGQIVASIPYVRRAMANVIGGRSIAVRLIVGCVIGAAAWVGGTKGPGATMSLIGQFVTALRSGHVIDESGVVARASEAAVVAAYADLSRDIVAAASNAVIDLEGEFARVEGLITNQERRVIYLSSYLPRAGTGFQAITNHNIAATLEQTRLSGDGLTLYAWVWFTAEPAFAPGMIASIDVGGGPFWAVNTTNNFPNTEDINGAPCVRYDFAIPSGARGVQLFPAYEVGFGAPGRPLIVPAGGILVETNGIPVLPYTGWDDYFSGLLRVRYAGGIAVEGLINGQLATNGVYAL